MIYFISDTHFGHRNIVRYRPFNDIEEMDNTLINNWNSTVHENDEVYILGDFIYKSDKHCSYYLRQLAGKKHFIVGNHDNKWMACGGNLSDYFVSIDNLKEIQDDKGRYLALCHYPLMEWRGSAYAIHDKDKGNNFLIHGHLHHQKNISYEFIKNNIPCALNAGVDINGYKPVVFEDLFMNNSIHYEREVACPK